MNKLSEFLTAALTAIGADVKAIFDKFDATGKLLRANLPTLTKSDVGLGNVNNTADANKTVDKANRLTTARRIEFSGSLRAFSDLYFDGSKDISIGVALQPVSAFSDLYGGSSYVRTPDNDADPASYAGGTRYSCVYGKSTDPWNNWATWGSYYLDTVSYGNREFLQTVFPDRKAYDPFKGMFVRRFSRGGIANSAANYKWVPISTNVYTYETTTTAAPNVYVGSDGVLKRSTNPPKSTVILEGTIGTPSRLFTYIPHGLDPAKIKSVQARVNATTSPTAGDVEWVWQNYTGAPLGATSPAGEISYAAYFDISVASYVINISAHKDAVNIHGKPVTIFIETY